MISTPCIKLCVIEPSLKLCIGCGRSLDEIGQWASLTELQRLEIMSGLPERMKGISQRDSGRILPSERRKARQAQATTTASR